MRVILYNTFYCSGLGKYRGQSSVGFYRVFLSSKKTLEKISNFLASCNPDIIGLTEVDHGSLKARFVNQINYIASKTGCYNVAFRCKYRKGSVWSKLPIFSQSGNALLSKQPFSSVHYYELSVGRKRLVIHLTFSNFHIFLVHLSLIRKNRKIQIKELSELVKKVQGNVIVMGDFNAKHQGDLLPLVSENHLIFVDQSNSNTFPAFKPRKCLDYILVSQGIKVKRFEVLPVKYSDHLPLLLEFDVVKET